MINGIRSAVCHIWHYLSEDNTIEATRGIDQRYCRGWVLLNLDIVNRLHRTRSDQLVGRGARAELGLLHGGLGTPGALLDLAKRKRLFGEQIIDALCILRCDAVQLCQIFDLDQRILHESEEPGSVIVQLLASTLIHHLFIQSPWLIVFGRLAFVVEMGFASDVVVCQLVRRLGNIWSELVHKAVRDILWVHAVIGIHAHLTIKIQGRIGRGHKRTVDGNLVEVDADSVILRIAVEEHAELQQGVRAVFNAGDHASRGECRLFNIAMEILGVLVEAEFTELLKLYQMDE